MANPGRPNKSNPEIDAMSFDIKNGNNEIVKNLLLKFGIDDTDGYLRTALILSTLYGNIALLTWLIDNGANINHQDRNGYTALHFAGQEKHFDCAKLLVVNGAKLEIADNHGNTPLWTAIFNSKGDNCVVNLFIENSANLDHINKYNMTPRQLAETFGGFDLKA